MDSKSFYNIQKGIFYGYPQSGTTFGVQALGWLVILSWSFLTSCVVFWGLKQMGIARVDLKTEVIGYDYVEFAKQFDFTGKRLIKRKEAATALRAVVEDKHNVSHEQNDDFLDSERQTVDVGAEVANKRQKPQEVQFVSKF